MEKLMNKKILAVIFLVAGVIIIVVALFFTKEDPVEPELKPNDDTETPIVPDDGEIIIPVNPDDPDPDYISTDPSEPVEPDDDDDTTPPEDDPDLEDTSGFPKPGDGDVNQGDTDSPKETSYKEIFDDPINPNTEPEKHKEVYEKVQDFVHFTVKYPTWMPERFMMTEVNADEGGILESGKYYGINIMTYIEEDKKIEIMEGMVDLGTTEEIEEVEIKDGVTGKLWKWQEYGTPSEDNTVLGLSVYFGSSAEGYQYSILGENVDKTDLIDIAKSLESL